MCRSRFEEGIAFKNQPHSRRLDPFSNLLPFQLVYVLEESPSLKLVVELLPATFAKKECLLHLTRLDETQCDVAVDNEAHKKRIKAQYDKNVKPCVFLEGDLVLLYDQNSEKLGSGKFEPVF